MRETKISWILPLKLGKKPLPWELLNIEGKVCKEVLRKDCNQKVMNRNLFDSNGFPLFTYTLHFNALLPNIREN